MRVAPTTHAASYSCFEAHSHSLEPCAVRRYRIAIGFGIYSCKWGRSSARVRASPAVARRQRSAECACHSLSLFSLLPFEFRVIVFVSTRTRGDDHEGQRVVHPRVVHVRSSALSLVSLLSNDKPS